MSANARMQAKDLVAQLLVVDPSQRLSAQEALAHPWVQVSSYSCGLATHDSICE